MLKTIDLFAGAGGLSFGFESTGKFSVVAAAENNKNARKTYQANHKNLVQMIEDVKGFNFRSLKKTCGDIDVVIGGPPCQGFSNANRQKSHIVSANNSLIKEFFRAVKEIRPKAFVMENVKMLTSETHRFYDSTIDHEEITRLKISLKAEEIVIAEKNYDGVDCLTALKSDTPEFYKISDALMQLLNVLYKNRNSKDRFLKYIRKSGNLILDKIEEYKNQRIYNYKILDDVSNSIETEDFSTTFDDLGMFLKYQKSFRLKEELDSNHILYTLKQDTDNGRIVAIASSYSVIEYVNKVLGNKYVKDSAVLNALQFGVPQERKRFVLMGIRSDVMRNTEITFKTGKLQSFVNVGNAIMDLINYPVNDDVANDATFKYNLQDKLSDYAKKMRKGSSGITNNIVPKTRSRALQRFASLKEGENFHKLDVTLKDNYADPTRTQNSVYLRLDRNKPSGTVTNVRKSMWIHPTLNRAISVREAARLQSFPDRFIFEGTKDSMYQQIGNAVPPLMAKGIAQILLRNLS